MRLSLLWVMAISVYRKSDWIFHYRQKKIQHYFFAVLAALLNCAAVGLPFAPALRIFSPLPAAILLRFACMLA